MHPHAHAHAHALPAWAAFTAAVVPMLAFVALVLWRCGGGGPDNAITHEQDGEQRGDDAEDGRFPLPA